MRKFTLDHRVAETVVIVLRDVTIGIRLLRPHHRQVRIIGGGAGIQRRVGIGVGSAGEIPESIGRQI